VRPALTEDDLQRIRVAIAGAHAEAPPQEPPVPAEAPAPSLPRREPGTGNEPEPPARTVPLHLSTMLLSFWPVHAPAEPAPAVPTSTPAGVAEEARAQPDTAAQPESAAVESAAVESAAVESAAVESAAVESAAVESAAVESAAVSVAAEPVPVQRSPAERPPGQQDRRVPKAAKPEKAPREPAPPKRPRQRGRARRRRVITAGMVATVVLVSAGAVTFALTRHAGTARAQTATRPEATVGDRAAAWVASQVSRSAVISCDQVICRALEAHGIPAAALLVLRPGHAQPLRSKVIVVTSAVTRMLGARTVAADAPAAIASFGSAGARISIRVIIPQGAAAYAAALRQDIVFREQSGTELLQNQRIAVSATGRQQLTSGRVDSRLLLTLANLASQWPVSILAFGDLAPGASPGIPLRGAEVAVTSSKAVHNTVAQLRLMSAFVRGLGDFYKSARLQTVRLAGGQNLLRITFAAPSPLGVLSPLPP
jgi:hypothetical protein